jgi:protein required for attachment to host cells
MVGRILQEKEVEAAMNLHWIVVANGSRAGVYASGPLLGSFTVEHELENRDSRQPSRELVSDDRGRRAGGPVRSGVETGASPHEREVERFARSVVEVLGAADARYERLIVVAPPRFLGLLRRLLPRAVDDRVVAAVAKDFTQVPLHELPARVRAVIPETAGLPA